MNMQSRIKTVVATMAITVFLAVVYYIPSDVFLSFLAAGLFMIPTAFFIYMIKKMEESA